MGGLGKKRWQKEVAQNGLRAPLEVIREDELYDIFKRGHNINLYPRELYFVIAVRTQNKIRNSFDHLSVFCWSKT